MQQLLIDTFFHSYSPVPGEEDTDEYYYALAMSFDENASGGQTAFVNDESALSADDTSRPDAETEVCICASPQKKLKQ